MMAEHGDIGIFCIAQAAWITILSGEAPDPYIRGVGFVTKPLRARRFTAIIGSGRVSTVRIAVSFHRRCGSLCFPLQTVSKRPSWPDLYDRLGGKWRLDGISNCA